MIPPNINPNLEKDIKSSFVLSRDIYFPRGKYQSNFKAATFAENDPTNLYTPLIPVLSNPEQEFQAPSPSYSLYELNWHQKLAKMRASSKVLASEDQQSSINIQKAINDLGGIKDTISSMQNELLENEIYNTTRTIKQGFSSGPTNLELLSNSSNKFNFDSLKTEKYTNKQQLPKPKYVDMLLKDKNQYKNPHMKTVLHKAAEERQKRVNKLYRHQKWSQSSVRDQYIEKFMFINKIKKNMGNTHHTNEQNDQKDNKSENDKFTLK